MTISMELDWAVHSKEQAVRDAQARGRGRAARAAGLVIDEAARVASLLTDVSDAPPAGARDEDDMDFDDQKLGRVPQRGRTHDGLHERQSRWWRIRLAAARWRRRRRSAVRTSRRVVGSGSCSGGRKYCKFCEDKARWVDYKDLRTLQSYIPSAPRSCRGASRGTCATHQRQLMQAIKRARTLALIPFTSD
jgi:small subunit ribosomal protein S18